jgi:hypothetical protein
MNRTLKKVLSIVAIAIVLTAVGITAVHHHLPLKYANHDCEICSFINILNTAISPIVVFLWILTLLITTIQILNRGISSENVKVYSSRAPPLILA